MSFKPHRILVPGTVLLDIYEETGDVRLGGAEFNFACHVHHLGGRVDLVARIGGDPEGRSILDRLNRLQFPTTLLQIDARKPSKTVRVRRGPAGDPVFLIPDDVASEYLEPPPLSPDRLAAYDLVYFGTTLQHGPQSRDVLRQLLKRSGGRRFCDLNLRPPKYSREIVDYSLDACDWLKINRDELEVLSDFYGLTGGEDARLADLAAARHLETVCLTLGGAGSLLWHQERMHHHPLPPGKPGLDPVGAGDAFAACLALGLLRGWTAPRVLDWASDLAAAVCDQCGAVPSDPAFYRRFSPPGFA